MQYTGDPPRSPDIPLLRSYSLQLILYLSLLITNFRTRHPKPWINPILILHRAETAPREVIHNLMKIIPPNYSDSAQGVGSVQRAASSLGREGGLWVDTLSDAVKRTAESPSSPPQVEFEAGLRTVF